MLPTFSVNVNPYEYTEKVIQLIKENPQKALVREWMSDAYIQILQGKTNLEEVNLQAYAQVCEKNARLKRKKLPETSLLSGGERDRGYTGLTDQIVDVVDGELDNILQSLDETYYIQTFLDVRERIYFAQGKDLWRLLELAKQDDNKAQGKLRILVDEYKLKELIEYILTRVTCYRRLEDVLC